MLGPVPGPTVVHDPSREEDELREYLGVGFSLASLQQSDARVDEEFAAAADEASFYRESEAYLYNLTAFAMTGTKLPYLEQLTAHVERGARILDYGCGIGSDGLLLLEQGYRVEFADFANPSTEYLRWRLARRGLEAPVHDLERHVPDGFDAAYSFDVIEHVPDPLAFLAELERRARLVAVNLLEPEPGDIDLHHDLPIAELRRHAARLGRLRGYRVYYGRSHLLLYEPSRGLTTGSAAQFANGLRIAGERLRRLGEGLRTSRRGDGSSRA
jgi:SAM-dependent methyltransferase